MVHAVSPSFVKFVLKKVEIIVFEVAETEMFVEKEANHVSPVDSVGVSASVDFHVHLEWPAR